MNVMMKVKPSDAPRGTIATQPRAPSAPRSASTQVVATMAFLQVASASEALPSPQAWTFSMLSVASTSRVIVLSQTDNEAGDSGDDDEDDDEDEDSDDDDGELI